MRDVETLFERITALNQRLNRWCQPNTTVPPSIVEHITRLFEYVPPSVAVNMPY